MEIGADQPQEFAYFVVIDFEATCDDFERGARIYPQEIIEFPSVLVNGATAHQEEEAFRTYVRPVHHPRLTDFCRKLTGIQQHQVDGGVPLSEALRAHDAWLEARGVKNGCGRFAVVTWGDWDCRTMLEFECRFKRIAKPEYFDRWINLQVPFEQWRIQKKNDRRSKSDEKTLADSLDYEKVETKKLREEKEALLKELQEANSAAQNLQAKINNDEVVMRSLQAEKISDAREASRASKAKDQEIEMLGSRLTEKETEIGQLQAKDQERSLLFNETARIAKENAEEVRTWKQLYDEAVANHKAEIEKLDSQLVEQVVENNRLLEASTCNIALLNDVLGEFRAEGKTPQEDTMAAHTSTIGEQVGILKKLSTTLKANQADSIREAVEGAVSYALAKLKAHDPNLNVQPIEVDFNCPEAEASQLIEEMQSIGKKVSEEMQLDSPSE